MLTILRCERDGEKTAKGSSEQSRMPRVSYPVPTSFLLQTTFRAEEDARRMQDALGKKDQGKILRWRWRA